MEGKDTDNLLDLKFQLAVKESEIGILEKILRDKESKIKQLEVINVALKDTIEKRTSQLETKRLLSENLRAEIDRLKKEKSIDKVSSKNVWSKIFTSNRSNKNKVPLMGSIKENTAHYIRYFLSGFFNIKGYPYGFDPYECFRRDKDMHKEIFLPQNNLGYLPLSELLFRKHKDNQYLNKDFDFEHYKKSSGIDFHTKEYAYKHWVEIGRKKGYEYAPGKNTILKIILKTKNEDSLLEDWLNYHAKLVGWENLIVVDNGSNSKIVLDIYKKYEDRLLVLTLPEEMENKKIHNVRELPAFFNLVKDNCLFMTVIDTDEFLCRYDGEKMTIDNFTENLSKYKKLKTVSTYWLQNYMYKDMPKSVKDVTYFNIKPEPIVFMLVSGKIIYRNNNHGRDLFHNWLNPKTNIVQDMVLLHYRKRCSADRISIQIEHCINRGFIKRNMSREEMIPLLEERFNSGANDVFVNQTLAYLKDKDAYEESQYDLLENKLLETNLVKHVLDGDPLKYKFVSDDFTSYTDLINKAFSSAKKNNHYASRFRFIK